MKKTTLTIASTLMIVSCFAIFAGCTNLHEHNFVETQIAATCTTEGYNLFTCSECNDSHIGDVVIPKNNHTGIGTCKICNTKFSTIWKNFLNENGDDCKIAFDGDIGVLLSYTDDYDCMLYAITTDYEGPLESQTSLTLAYNIYDQKWSWLFDCTLKFSDLESSGTAFGSFSQWSSHSSSLNCSKRTGAVKDMSDSLLLSEVKTLYNKILDCANSKLKECGINITMVNFGLEK